MGNVARADVAAVCAGLGLKFMVFPLVQARGSKSLICVAGAVAATDPLNSGAGKTFEMFKARPQTNRQLVDLCDTELYVGVLSHFLDSSRTLPSDLYAHMHVLFCKILKHDDQTSATWC